MDIRTRTIALWSGVAILIVAGIVTLSLAFGGSKKDAVVDVNAIYTNAASTVAAQQQTLQAGTFVATTTPTISFPTATAALSTLPSPTFQQQNPGLLPTVKPVGGTVAVTGCDVAVYVSDVTIADGTTIEAGKSFTKTWKVSNIGACAWTETYQLVFVSGDSLGGKATPIGKIVKPGESADISVILTSSSATGNITGTWRLSNDKGQSFGDSLTVVINSGAKAGTITPTPTVGSAAATATYTPTPTTSAATNIPVPTETPMPAPTPTNISG